MTKPATTTAPAVTAATPPVITIVPIDPADAHGIGAVVFRKIDPRELHETAEEASDRKAAWLPRGLR